ncbi:Putative D-3-phosphoglycerate dehydrogenase [Rhizopus microsporus]|nr:Putative D-3-phosphoglycerate dehydrogenase [Rhizopus microsporus]
MVNANNSALVGDELLEKIKDAHVIGIRSKTKLTKQVLEQAKNLLAIGCFCIGTNQVDLQAAANQGIAVFNSPFSNSRSVAELVIGEIITLARHLGDRNNEMHSGVWNKVSKNCFEIRGKVLGIVGYGHIGSQLSVLAEAMGMTVYFYDVIQIMPLGQAKPVDSLHELLAISDFVTLHVPETEETKNMIGEQELQKMKKGAYLINNARGTVVQIPALEINRIFADHNVEKQHSDSKGNIAYVMADIANITDLKGLYDALVATPSNIQTRILY